MTNMNWVSIDFGNSYSAATVWIDGKASKVNPIDGQYGGSFGFPTVAYIGEDDIIRVCNDAMDWRELQPERFLKDFKLNIYEDELAYMNVRYVDIIARILGLIKQSAEAAIGGEAIDGAILTIPATYSENDPRKEIMREAAIGERGAGFVQVEFVKEAEAAAVYYHSIQKTQAGTTTLIYDLGGGTFDPALVEHRKNGYALLGSVSGKECGGKYFEAALYKHFKEKYSLSYSEDETQRTRQIDEIAKVCRKIKEALSSKQEVSYPILSMNRKVISCTRNEFESLIRPLLESTFQECSTLIASSGKEWKDISRILLIGGSSTIPCVKEYFRKYLKGKNQSNIPIVLNKSEEGKLVDTLYAVSIGGLLTHNKNTSNETIDNEPVAGVKTSSEIINGHAYIDMGLSVKWATCNVGANSPSDYGNYYAWGETSPKSTYTDGNSKTYHKSTYKRDIGGDPDLDAARANWGGTWRLPTEAEFRELIDNCDWQWSTQDGYNGYKVSSKKNGNSIFLPAAGDRYGSSPRGAGENGNYWSSSPYGSYSYSAHYLYMHSSGHHTSWCLLYAGMPVRPVSE